MTLQPGQTILKGKYRIEERIGKGAFAEVYRATHLALHRQVAIKVLRRTEEALGSTRFQEYRDRFALEAELGAQFDDPHLVKVFDFEEDASGGVLYLVMEYASGDSLEKKLKEDGPLPVEDAVCLARDVAQGLALLHRHKPLIVHRDLKPSNILYGADGTAKVGDLGLAQVPKRTSRRSVAGSLAEQHPGTPEYMCPEQEETVAYLRPACDVWALGAVLFEVLTGSLYKDVKPGTRVRDLRAEVPAWLDELVTRCVAEERKTRLWDGAEVLAALEAGGAEARRQMEESASAAEEAHRKAAVGEQAPQERKRPTAAEAAQREAERRRQEAARRKAKERAQAGTERTGMPTIVWVLAALLLLVVLGGGGVWVVGRPPATATPQASAGEATRTVVRQEVAKGGPEPVAVTATSRSATATSVLPTATLRSPTASTRPPTATPVLPTHALASPIDPTSPSTLTSPSNPPTQANCGDIWIRPKDGLKMVYIPANSFFMGSESGEGDERPVHLVQIDGFWIDQFEVTNLAFEHFVMQTGYRTDAEREGWGNIWQDGHWKRVDGLNWRHPHNPDKGISEIMDNPVVQVSWNDANAYCQWVGGRLPKEAMWELAAIGTTRWRYPWGNAFDPTRLNASKRGTTRVGSYEAGKSPCGAYDMAGNVWEWVFDWYQRDFYSSSPTVNPQGPPSGTYRTLRGGGWDPSGGDSRSTDRGALYPSSRGDTVGFRCSL